MSDQNPTTIQATEEVIETNLEATNIDDSDIETLRRTVKNLQDESRRYRTEARTAKAQLKQVDPQILAEAQAKADAAEQQRLLVEQQTELRLQAMQQKLETETAKIRSESQALAEAARRETLRVKTEREFNAAEGLTEASEIDGSVPFDLAWKHFGDRFEEDAQGIYLKGADGLPQTDPETNKRITPRQFFEKLRDDRVHGTMFKPRYGSGGGSRAGVTGRVGQAQDLSGMASTDLISQGLKAQRETVRR
jgi:hypothetical protein